jgi:hypothetical protein
MFSGEGRPEDAMAFVRVVADVHAEFIAVWREPVEELDIEYPTGSGFVIAPSGWF